MELSGRDRELARVLQALDDVRDGGRRTLAVVGEAGIGKSALLAAIAERAAPLRVLRGRAAEHEHEVPFALAVDAFDAAAAALAPRRLEALDASLRGVLPAFGEPRPAPAGPAERLRVHRALADLLDQLARERPVVLVVDDVHWADEASLELLDHLVRRPPAAPHLLVLAARPGARLPDVEQLVLEPLDLETSVALLGDVPEREAKARTAGGNPLFLRELARSRGDALPPTLIAAVRRETDGLDSGPARLLAGAAVAGDPFDPELAAAAAGAIAEAATLDALVLRDLVRPVGPGRAFAFRHPLVREAVYDALPPAWRLEAHERAAAALATRGAGPTARAHHVERYARPGDRTAVAVLREAATRASTPASAARWYGAALRLLGDDVKARAALLVPMGSALAAAGRFRDAREALLEAQGVTPSIELTVAIAQIETELGRYADARRRLRLALDAEPVEDRAGVTFELAAVAYYEGRLGELGAWTGAAIEAAAGDRVLHAGALALGALAALWIDEPERAEPLLDEAVALLEGATDDALERRPAAALFVATAQLLGERYGSADASASRALEVTARTGQDQLAVALRLTRAMARLHRGALGAALDDAELAEELARLQGVPRLLHFALWLRALVHHERGEAVEAARAAAECTRLGATLEGDKLVRSGASTVAMLAAGEEPERAILAIGDASGADVEIGDRSWSAWLLLRLVRAALSTGATVRAEHWARVAANRGGPVGTARARLARAELELARGDGHAASALAAEAAVAAGSAGSVLDALEARLLEGRALAAAGDPERAKATLQGVASGAGHSQALRLRDAARRELRALGAQLGAPARRAAGGELTERERAIATLVGDGRSNQQVAATLHLSQKTVANALTRVYAKLGVRSRTQLARESIPR